jgi:hypothetical protein
MLQMNSLIQFITKANEIESINQVTIIQSLALDMEKPQNENHQQNHFTTTATAAQQ